MPKGPGKTIFQGTEADFSGCPTQQSTCRGGKGIPLADGASLAILEEDIRIYPRMGPLGP